ncbi:MAG: hypothetical protein ACYCSN_16635 [Acidobacteriaceae bacterium]
MLTHAAVLKLLTTTFLGPIFTLVAATNVPVQPHFSLLQQQFQAVARAAQMAGR